MRHDRMNMMNRRYHDPSYRRRGDNHEHMVQKIRYAKRSQPSTFPNIDEGSPQTPKATLVTDGENVVVCVVEWEVPGFGTYQIAESARLHPLDKFDYEVGSALAMSRAFKTASKIAREHARDRARIIGIGNV